MSGMRIERGTGQSDFTEPPEPLTQEQEDADTDLRVAAFQAGDKEAFSVLYLRYFERVYGYMRVAFESQHEAEDATQQVFTKVFEALPRYERRDSPFRVWLFVVVRNEAITELKRLARMFPVDPAELDREREAAAPELDPAELAELAELDALGLDLLSWIGDPDLRIFLERLPSAQRQVLALRYTLDLSNKQIAKLLNRTANDVAVLQRRALIFVRKRLIAVGRRYEKGEKGAAGADEIQMKAFNPQSRVLRERRFTLRK